jgi:hypothetical protein
VTADGTLTARMPTLLNLIQTLNGQGSLTSVQHCAMSEEKIQ